MEYRKQSNCVYYCNYHIVIVTKYRRKVLNDGILAYIKECLKRMVEYYPEVEILKMNHDKDHIHFQVSIPPTMSVGKAVGLIKQNTARDLKQKFPFLKQVYWGTEAVWSEGYFASTIGMNDKVVKAYIENQGKKDAGQTMFEIS